MNIRNTLISFLILFLTLSTSEYARAGNVYKWTDIEGSVHFSDVSPHNTSTIIAYKETTGDKAYQWTDKEGGVHFSDVPPVNTPTIKIHEIKIDSFDDNTIDAKKYSIVNQVERMAAHRRQLEEARLVRERTRLEEYRMAQELEILRLNELIRTQGYGPRPYYYPYAQSNYNQRRHVNPQPGYSY